MILQHLLNALSDAEWKGLSDPEQKVCGITSDSRAVKPGWVFVALKGERADGHRFVGDAIARGCIAAVVEHGETLPEKTPLVRVADSHQAYGLLAAEYFGHPAREIKMLGLTGTNGKTTTSWIIEQAVKEGGGKPGVIGTVNYRYLGYSGEQVEIDAPLTTPEPMLLQGLLREMRDAGVTHAILEVSSHSLVQQRLAGLFFDVTVFTNLTRDHLDYHGSMEAYFAAKRKLFDEHMQPSGVAVVNLRRENKFEKGEVDWERRLLEHLKEKGFLPYPVRSGRSWMSCGFDNNCTLHAEDIRQDIKGTACTFICGKKSLAIRSGLIGMHNVSNMMTAAGACLALGIPHDSVVKGIGAAARVPGRLERVALPGANAGKSGPSIFVDYAHTPDALENVLRTLRPLTPGRLCCVFGCGGDRDRGKRPLMGEVAANLADTILVTSDNPRGEDPAMILAAIEKGVQQSGIPKLPLGDLFALAGDHKGYTVLEDRCQAIHTMCAWAGERDVVLIAGKGHETYQITAAGKRFFDDRIEARNGRMRWTKEHLVAAIGGRVQGAAGEALLGRISTDTRTLWPGDVFVALRGGNFDGHDYVDTAVSKGAAAVIVEKDLKSPLENVLTIQVADTLRALGDLARYRRRLVGSDVKVIAITGSSGKTTVKEMTASILEAAFEKIPGCPVLKTQGNLNNLVGLPLSLLNIDGGHRAAVMEMGMNRPGEIERLAGIAEPDIGCITNVQAAHLEGLGTIEGVAQAKGELFSAMAGRGVRIINYDDPHIRKMGRLHGNNVVTFAVTPDGRRFNPAVRATRIVSRGEEGMRFTLHINAWRGRIDVPATGVHNVANCAAAAAIATAAGVAPDDVVRGLTRYRHGDKRLQVVALPGGIKVVNDSYNANPGSMAAALRTVGGFGGNCRRIALLGDMLELGGSAPTAHAQIGALVAELGYDFLGVTGEFAANVTTEAVRSGMGRPKVRSCPDKAALVEWVADLIKENRIGAGDWILIKGSRGMRMEFILHELTAKLAPKTN